MPVTDLCALVSEDFCYLTTTGRLTGRPHEIEIWFALVPERRALYMLSGGGDRSDWVKNLRRYPDVEVRIGGSVLAVAPARPKTPKRTSWRGGCWSRSTRAVRVAWRAGAAERCPWWWTWRCRGYAGVAPKGEDCGRRACWGYLEESR